VDKKPRFEDFFDRKRTEYHVSSVPSPSDIVPRCLTSIQCAATMLGVSDPKGNYESFSTKKWNDALKAQIDDSGLPDARKRLSVDVVAHYKQGVLKSDSQYLSHCVHKIVKSQRY
jgi:hypothetical protein